MKSSIKITVFLTTHLTDSEKDVKWEFSNDKTNSRYFP